MSSSEHSDVVNMKAAAPSPSRTVTVRRRDKFVSRLLAGGIALLLGLAPAARADQEDKTTLVFVNSKVADREKFTALIHREFRKSQVYYTSVDANADADVMYDVMSGIDRDNIKKYHTLVIISDFKNATVRYGNRTQEAAEKHWIETFAAAKKGKAPQLRLLSTANEPPATYLRCVDVSGGEYRRLRQAASGVYE